MEQWRLQDECSIANSRSEPTAFAWRQKRVACARQTSQRDGGRSVVRVDQAFGE